jgi:NAD(P)-dependent dehydrogenase (short-subunit alcohol dehydrogenase family)
MNHRMKNRLIVITGGGTGIGAATALLFAEEGARTIIIGRRKEHLKATVGQIRDMGGQADFCCADVASVEEIKSAFDVVHKEYGLINSAGVVYRLEDPREFSDIEWNWQMNINAKGAFHTIKFALPDLIARKGGTIVNIASLSASRASPGYATYSASKGALISYTRVVAMQFAEYGIRANSISPGIVNTPMASVDRDQEFSALEPQLAKIHPLGRVGIPKDIAYLALFLSCDESSWITGQDIIIDGGISAKF